MRRRVPIAHRYDEKAPKMSSSSAVGMDDVSDADTEQMETLSMVQLESHAECCAGLAGVTAVTACSSSHQSWLA